jgi:NAD(P)-dependent dehydrogenase (short-subunit alcohol dehydrogenase family)
VRVRLPAVRCVRSLRGAPAAVTGAGRGLAERSLDLARAGARVAIDDVDVEAAEGVAREISADAFAFGLDVTDPEGFRAFLGEAERRHGRLGLLVTNVGVDWIGPFHEEPDEVTLREIEVNLCGTALGSLLPTPSPVAALLPAFSSRRAGPRPHHPKASNFPTPPLGPGRFGAPPP